MLVTRPNILTLHKLKERNHEYKKSFVWIAMYAAGDSRQRLVSAGFPDVK
jgi:hypothetical protein